MDENNEKKKKKWRSYRANISANIDTNSSSQNAGQEFSSPSILIKTGRFRDKSASDNVGAPEKDSVVTIIPRPTALLSKPKDTSSICEDSSNSKNFASVQDSEGTDPPQGANQKAASLVQRKISKADKSNPQNAPVPAEEEAEYESLLPMSLAIRLIGDHLEFMDYVLNHLSNTNTQFTVIGAIGPQGCGKSTLLSMLTGNNSQDLYRHYTFRCAMRETTEECKYQTSKISIYVTKDRMILLDCQALFSAAILDDVLRNRPSIYQKLDELSKGKAEIAVEIESLQFISFLLQICHTVLFCFDWFLDIDVIRHVRVAEMLRIPPHPFTIFNEQVSPKPHRRTNLVFVHNRAEAEDFLPCTIIHRSNILNRLFADSSLNINGGLSVLDILPDSFKGNSTRVNYIPLPDFKNRSKFEHFQSEYDQLPEGIIDYDKIIKMLRIRLLALPKDGFTNKDQMLTEKQWYCLASKTWRSSWSNADLAKFASFMTSS